MKKIQKANDYAKNCLKPPKAFFDWCYEQMPTYVWKNKEEEIIASERNHNDVREKRLTKNSRLTFYDRKENFMTVLCTKKRIEIQTYTIVSKFENGKQIFLSYLLNLEQLANDNHIKIGLRNIDHYEFGLTNTGTMFSYSTQYLLLYQNNWLNRIGEISELRYLDLEEEYPEELPHIYKYRRLIEFAQKIGASELASEIIAQRLDMRKVTVNWLKRNKEFFKKSDRKYSTWELKNEIENRGGKLIDGAEKYLSIQLLDELPNGLSLIRFQNYLIKHKVNARYYVDYINTLKDLNISLSERHILPKDIYKAHDEAVARLNAMKREVVRKEFAKRAKELKELEMRVQGYQFILPKDAKELIEEGKSLEMCVGGSSYINSHANGETTIVLIRRANELDKPYYTLEYRDKKIIQLHGYKNKNADKFLQEASNEWLKRVNELIGGEIRHVS